MPTFEASDQSIYRPSDHYQQTDAVTLNVRCPHCGRLGAFSRIGQQVDIVYHKRGRIKFEDGRVIERGTAAFRAGLRQCPNLECRGWVSTAFYTLDDGAIHVAWVSPPELIDFRVERIPTDIVSSVTEALAAHSVQAYRAAALMVRRALEQLCEHKGAKGKDLFSRLKALEAHAILSPTLLSAAHNLRLLGADAAHVESKHYDSVDREHSEVAIELAKRILEAVYQHDDLVERLEKLKKT